MQLKNDITVYRYGISHQKNIRNVWSYSIVYYTCLFIRWKKNAILSFVLDWKFVEIFIRKTFLKNYIWRSCLVRINLLCLTYNYSSTQSYLGCLFTLATNMPEYQECNQLFWFTLFEIIYCNDDIVNVNGGNASTYSLIRFINESMSPLCTLTSNQKDIFSF